MIELSDPLAEALGARRPKETFRYAYEDAVKLSGHSCPTVAGAYLVTEAALRALYPGAIPVRGEIEVIVGGTAGDGRAGPTAQVIALITGAATETGFGGLMGRWKRRGLLRFDPAAEGVRFTRRDTGASVEVRYHPERIPAPKELGALLGPVLAGSATRADADRFAGLWQARVEAILAAPERVLEVHAA
jgi:hypothetical protein